MIMIKPRAAVSAPQAGDKNENTHDVVDCIIFTATF